MEPTFLAMLEEAAVEAQCITDLVKRFTTAPMFEHSVTTDEEMVLLLT